MAKLVTTEHHMSPKKASTRLALREGKKLKPVQILVGHQHHMRRRNLWKRKTRDLRFFLVFLLGTNLVSLSYLTHGGKDVSPFFHSLITRHNTPEPRAVIPVVSLKPIQGGLHGKRKLRSGG